MKGASKYVSAGSLVQYGYELVNAEKLDQSLRLVHDFVERIITEPLCTARVFGSKDLDALCQRIGKASLSAVTRQKQGDGVAGRDSVFVYVVTKLENSGGLRQVIEDLIKVRFEARHIILSTELEGRSDVGYLQSGLGRQTSVRFEGAPQGSYQQRLAWLQQRLLDIHPQKVFLFNYHQDSVAVAAIQPEMGLTGSFYHHGDHHLCLGVFLDHLEHIDPHPMGYHHCRDVLNIENSYIPLVVEDKGPRPPELPFFYDGRLTTCTAARSNKVDIPYFVRYFEMVPRLLKTTGGRHVHIGRLHPWTLFKIRRGLKRYGIAPDRFIYIPWVPSVWKTLHEYRVDLYVASFPYGGGLTLIEAMGAGVPVALHRHVFSRILSGLDLAYPEAFSWRFPDELLTFCGSVTADTLKEASRLGRRRYEGFHRPEMLRRILQGNADDLPAPASLSDRFSPEPLEWALWMEKQVDIKNVLYKAAYRFYRRLRGRWHFM